MQSNERNSHRENVFHERTSMLSKESYRGFTVSKIRKEWDGVQVTARNAKGRRVTSTGETNEEAFARVIDKIDLILDEPRS